MIVLIEPISKNIGMYVPAYPLPLLEIASFVSHRHPETEIRIISMPMDYGLPLSYDGREQIYQQLISDLSKLKPKGIGISCTAIAQAEEVIHLCEKIKSFDPHIFIFLGGYFPTIYYEDILIKTSAVDVIVTGEGEIPTLILVEQLEKGNNPIYANIPNLVWKKDGHFHSYYKNSRFDLNNKALLDLKLLRHPGDYDILPYAFSRGCPYQCNFCMENYIRPHRRKVPLHIIQNDLAGLLKHSNTHTLLISDALFRSFNLFPFFQSLGVKTNFETRCDILDPSLLSRIADACGMIALGFESASYNTLRRMNKVKDRSHYQHYISNTTAIFKEAVRNEIPMVVFMIAGYPGDTEEDLKESLAFAQKLSLNKGAGGYVFKIGECHVYPKTKIYELARLLPDVVFDDDGVFGQNTVRQSSKNLKFDTIQAYAKEIFELSNHTQKLQNTFLNMMPFFRLPVDALQDEILPDACFSGKQKGIFNVRGNSLTIYKSLYPKLTQKYRKLMSGERTTRTLTF